MGVNDRESAENRPRAGAKNASSVNRKEIQARFQTAPPPRGGHSGRQRLLPNFRLFSKGLRRDRRDRRRHDAREAAVAAPSRLGGLGPAAQRVAAGSRRRLMTFGDRARPRRTQRVRSARSRRPKRLRRPTATPPRGADARTLSECANDASPRASRGTTASILCLCSRASRDDGGDGAYTGA